MDMIPTSSSVVKRVGYDFATSTLHVELDSGRTYEYLNVPANVYGRFMAAASMGKFFNLEIKGKYNSREIRPITTTVTTDTGRQLFHALLDRAMNEAVVGKSFLPKFVELVIENGSAFK